MLDIYKDVKRKKKEKETIILKYFYINKKSQKRFLGNALCSKKKTPYIFILIYTDKEYVRVKKWIKQIYNNIMWKAHKIIFLEMSEWYSKYLIIPSF